MSTSYQVHVKTVGQMKALLDYYAAKGFAIIDGVEASVRANRYFKMYPWPVIYPTQKEIGGNKTEHSNHTTISFDQAFDIPEKKTTVEFYHAGITCKVSAPIEDGEHMHEFKATLGNRELHFQAARLIEELTNAIKELNQQ